MKTLSKNAVVLNSDGYRTQSGIKVVDLGQTILIANTEHAKDDLQILKDRIIGLAWEVIL